MNFVAFSMPFLEAFLKVYRENRSISSKYVNDEFFKNKITGFGNCSAEPIGFEVDDQI